jgi:PAS domain S-box-containing protein
MSEQFSILDLTDELRVRVAELEGLHRGGGGADPTIDSKQLMADIVVSNFVEHPEVMLFVADLVEGRFLRCNKAVCDVLGYSERDLLEVSFIDRVHPDDRTKTMLEMGRLAAGEQTRGFRNRYLDVTGTYRVFEWTAIADQSRELCYAMAVEVTE